MWHIDPFPLKHNCVRLLHTFGAPCSQCSPTQCPANNHLVNRNRSKDPPPWM